MEYSTPSVSIKIPKKQTKSINSHSVNYGKTLPFRFVVGVRWDVNYSIFVNIKFPEKSLHESTNSNRLFLEHVKTIDVSELNRKPRSFLGSNLFNHQRVKNFECRCSIKNMTLMIPERFDRTLWQSIICKESPNKRNED